MQVNVITMLLGDIGREAGGMSPATDDKWPCVKSDFCSAVLRGVCHRSISRTVSVNRPTEYRYVQVTSAIRKKSRIQTVVNPACYLLFSPKFSLSLSEILNHVRYRVGLEMKFFSAGCDLQKPN